jgi:hypothetical protein
MSNSARIKMDELKSNDSVRRNRELKNVKMSRRGVSVQPTSPLRNTSRSDINQSDTSRSTNVDLPLLLLASIAAYEKSPSLKRCTREEYDTLYVLNAFRKELATLCIAPFEDVNLGDVLYAFEDFFPSLQKKLFYNCNKGVIDKWSFQLAYCDNSLRDDMKELKKLIDILSARGKLTPRHNLTRESLEKSSKRDNYMLKFLQLAIKVLKQLDSMLLTPKENKHVLLSGRNCDVTIDDEKKRRLEELKNKKRSLEKQLFSPRF